MKKDKPLPPDSAVAIKMKGKDAQNIFDNNPNLALQIAIAYSQVDGPSQKDIADQHLNEFAQEYGPENARGIANVLIGLILQDEELEKIRKERLSKAGKKSAASNRENKTGLFGFTRETFQAFRRQDKTKPTFSDEEIKILRKLIEQPQNIVSSGTNEGKRDIVKITDNFNKSERILKPRSKNAIRKMIWKITNGKIN